METYQLCCIKSTCCCNMLICFCNIPSSILYRKRSVFDLNYIGKFLFETTVVESKLIFFITWSVTKLLVLNDLL